MDMENRPVLSICIPTYKRPDILRNTLNSIYTQDIDHGLFEVCISDDSPTDETEKMIQAEFSGLENLVYNRTPECGFLNLIEALKLGHGQMLKLLNDYAALKNGTLKKIIALVDANIKEQPVIYFGLSSLKNRSDVVEFTTFNSFIKNVDYMCTFCSAINIWKSDFDKIVREGIKPNFAFPHTTFLFKHTYKNKYVVDNFDYVDNQQLEKKGGYNLPEYFIKEYLTMIKKYLLTPGYIEKSTYKQLEHNILKFVAGWFWTVMHDDRYLFTFDGYAEIIESQCGLVGLGRFRYYKNAEYVKRALKCLARKLIGRS